MKWPANFPPSLFSDLAVVDFIILGAWLAFVIAGAIVWLRIIFGNR